jgi:hypothetical protein
VQPAERRERFGVQGAAQGGERCRHHDHVVDERRLPLLEPALEPTRSEPTGARPVAERHERGQLERLVEVEAARLARLELGADEVPAVDGATERRSRMALGSRARTPFLGPDQWRA